MAADALPPEVLRVLSTHGEVLLTVGQGDAAVTGRCGLAPLDEALVLFVRPGAALSQAVRRDTRAILVAASAEKGYNVRLTGRAVAGPSVLGHPQRLGLLAWLPEGASPRAWEALRFLPDAVDYQRAGEGERFVGRVPRATPLPGVWTVWTLAAFEGGWAFAAAGVLGVWAWILVQGPAMPLRGVAVLLAAVGVLGLVAAGGLWFRAQSFLSALERGAAPRHAALLEQGLLSPGAARQGAVAALALGLVASAITVLWGPRLTGVTLLFSFAWLHWPLRMTAVFTGEDPPAE